jgi:hypothetical protein
MRRGCEGEACLIKKDATRDHDAINGKSRQQYPLWSSEKPIKTHRAKQGASLYAGMSHTGWGSKHT